MNKKKQPSTKSIRISKECYDRLKDAAKVNLRTISGQIEFLVRQA